MRLSPEGPKRPVVGRAAGAVFDRAHVERHFDRNDYFGNCLDDTGCESLA